METVIKVTGNWKSNEKEIISGGGFFVCGFKGILFVSFFTVEMQNYHFSVFVYKNSVRQAIK